MGDHRVVAVSFFPIQVISFFSFGVTMVKKLYKLIVLYKSMAYY